MRQNLTPFFQFTTSERRGIIVLSIIILFLIGFRISIPYFLKNSDVEIKPIYLFNRADGGKANTNRISAGVKSKPLERQFADFKIDPNIANYEQLVAFGFQEFAANNIIKYRNKGGVFYNSKDLLKIYGIENDSYTKFADKLIFNVKIPVKDSLPTTNKFNLSIDVNQADSSRLAELPGIGRTLSKRIIKYRNLLGGFYKMQQLKEVYGISDETFENIKEYIIIDTVFIQKININQYDEKYLKSHPYINNYQARAIIKYRDLMSDFKTLDELKDNYIFTNEEFSKIRPYLKIN